MGLTKMNYSISEKVIDIYAELLDNVELSKMYRYSDMKGYDIVDISNSLRLMTAYHVYKAYNNDSDQMEKFEKYATEDQSGILQYFMNFIPDDKILEQDMLDKNSPEYLKGFTLKLSYSQDLNTSETSVGTETMSSFLDFCLQIKGEENYWIKVYDRLNLGWETEDEYDKIYYEIKKGQKNEPEPMTSSEQFSYKSWIIAILYMVTFGALIWGLAQVFQ